MPIFIEINPVVFKSIYSSNSQTDRDTNKFFVSIGVEINARDIYKSKHWKIFYLVTRRINKMLNYTYINSKLCTFLMLFMIWCVFIIKTNNNQNKINKPLEENAYNDPTVIQV